MTVSNNFLASTLDLGDKVSISQPTALSWGPDGRLYVTEVSGAIKVLTIGFGDPDVTDIDFRERFFVQSAIELDDVRLIPNYNDNGTPSATAIRQVTGIDVTAQFDAEGNPVFFDGKAATTIYVSSSDSRVGAGGDGADIGLDTNSGVITKLVQTGPNSWTAIDIVRGLPRSEENHATNGLQVVQTLDAEGRLVSERMLVASGGNSNNGAPSNNFAGQAETALSAAILEIDLDLINTLPVQTDINGRQHVYDIPTLDDPAQPGATDVADPFGGNDNFNQAKLVDDGVVSIYSPGYRNSYEVLVTEDGRVYTYDNGSNNSWGGRPIGEANPTGIGGQNETPLLPGYIATNLNNGDGNANDEINLSQWDPGNRDHLHEITRSDDLADRTLAAGRGGAQTYIGPDGLTYVYGGHANPVRAEGSRAGLLFSPKAGTEDSFLLVSNEDTAGNGGGSDYDEVVAWLAQVEADDTNFPDVFNSNGDRIFGAGPGDLVGRVLAVTPGLLYQIYRMPDGSGAAYLPGDPALSDPGFAGVLLGSAGLPSDIGSIVSFTNSIEGNYLEGGKSDGAIDSGFGSINGLAEYTSTVLDGDGVDMSGALIASSLGGGNLIVIGRDANGVVQTRVQNNSVNGVVQDSFTLARHRTTMTPGGPRWGSTWSATTTSSSGSTWRFAARSGSRPTRRTARSSRSSSPTTARCRGPVSRSRTRRTGTATASIS